MSKFNRGLSDAFLETLKSDYNKPRTWWRPFLSNKKSFIAIRENYLNVYYRGASLLKLSQSSDKTVKGRIHYKYLLRPELKGEPKYVDIVDGKPRIPKDAFMNDLNEIEDPITDLQKAVKSYTDAEKTGVHRIFQKNCNTLDVEVDFPGGKNYRLDLTAIRKEDLTILFYEAKTFSYLKNLKKKGPSVVEQQIKKYTDLLQKHRCEIVDSYSQVCKNLYELYGLTQPDSPRYKFLGRILDRTKELSVDVHPRLLVFGYDKDQKKGTLQEIQGGLEDRLGKGMVFCKGDAKEFVRGISK